MPLINEFCRIAVRKGANIILDIMPEEYENELLLNGTEEQMKERYRQKLRLARISNKLILIESSENPEFMELVPNERQKLLDEMETPYYAIVWSPKRQSVLVHFPTKGYARQSGLGLSEYEEAVYKMTLLNWEEESEKMQKVSALFKGVRRLKMEGKDTDLTLRLNGNPTIEDGRENLPGGEVYFGGRRGASANGKVYFDVPVFYGKGIRDAKLEFGNGIITRLSASMNEDYLRSLLLGQHVGFLEEIGFGTNPYASINVHRWAEKTYGTVHLGVDNNHGTNIDITKTMNPGRVVAYELGDRKGRTILENGRFLL